MSVSSPVRTTPRKPLPAPVPHAPPPGIPITVRVPAPQKKPTKIPGKA